MLYATLDIGYWMSRWALLLNNNQINAADNVGGSLQRHWTRSILNDVDLEIGMT